MRTRSILPLVCVLLVIPAPALWAKDSLPRRPYFGAQLKSIPDSVRMSLSKETEGGLIVGTVQPQSPAEAAGLRTGDVVLMVDEFRLSDTQGLTAALAPHKAGETVSVSFLRDHQAITRRIKLAPFPKESSEAYDVLYESVKVGDSLRRVIFTKPKAKGKYSVILLVGGIGCYTLDLPSGAYHPYNTLIAELAASGFVTVRVEKSGMGDSQGPSCAGINFTTELDGYRAALRALSAYEFCDTTRVILLGHSMGGMAAPLLYESYPVKGIIAIATAATSWFEYELINQRRQLELEGTDYDTIEVKAAQKELVLHELLVEKKSPEEILAEHPGFEEHLQYPCHYRYIQEVASQNLARAWKTVEAPTLILWGQGDFVTSREDHRYLTDLINHDHPGHATFVEIPAMDHFLRRITTPRESYDNLANGSPNKEFSSDLLPVILDWCRKR